MSYPDRRGRDIHRDRLAVERIKEEISALARSKKVSRFINAIEIVSAD